MTLNDWQSKLHSHFASLRQQVNDSGSVRPLFALEHDLNEDEWSDLVAGLKIHTHSTGPAERHWLAWCVYAAEIGYSFQGDQYWQTFARDLPNWNDGERDFVKDAFIKFRREFGGVEPSGAWANSFTIICWPIANAILPKDLQRHLASILYEIRDLSTDSLIRDPPLLGSLIESHSEGTSKRFKQFAGQHALVGRIASALLLSDSGAVSKLLLPSTLSRITKDLQKEQNSRDWLSVAKQRASLVTVHGTRSNDSPSIPVAPHLKEEFRKLGSRDPQVEVLLRQTAEDSWSLRARIPNLGPLAVGHPAFQRILSTQRSFVDASPRRHFPPRFFAQTEREVEITTLPAMGIPFLRFEDTADGFRNFLDRYCSFPGFSSMLFKLHDGGDVTRLRSRTLRQDNRYLYIDSKPFSSTTVMSSSRSVSLGCEGLYGLLIDVPNRTNFFYIMAANALGLDIAKGVRVRPVAYPSLTWSGDGDVSWLTSAPKLLSIDSDIEANGYVLNLVGSGSAQVLECPASNTGPSFVDLTELGSGEYQLHVIAHVPLASEQLIAGSLSISILPEEKLVLDKELARGFTVLMSPSLPSLEQLWNGSSTLDIYGPVGKAISCQVNFHSDAGVKQSDGRWSGKSLTLPVTADEWQIYLDGARNNKQLQSAYELSASASICLRSIELGQTVMHFEREFVPFKWFLRERNSSNRLQLIQNDTSEKVDVVSFDFATPNLPHPLVSSTDGEVSVPKTGGLFIANRGNISIAIVVPPAPMNSFLSLGTVIGRLPAARTIEDVLRLAETIKYWTEAQLLGDFLSRGRRDAAIKSLRVSLIETLCGPKWVSAEADYEYGRIGFKDLSEFLGQGSDYRLSRAAMIAASSLEQATPADIAGIALDLAVERKHNGNVVSASSADSIQNIICLQEILRLDDRSVAPLPIFDEECAKLAAQIPNLGKVLRYLLLAKQSVRANSIQRIATVSA